MDFGKSMIAQGTNGLFRVDLSSGVKRGQKLLTYLPMNETTFERQACLKDQIKSCVDKKWKVATTED